MDGDSPVCTYGEGIPAPDGGAPDAAPADATPADAGATDATADRAGG